MNMFKKIFKKIIFFLGIEIALKKNLKYKNPLWVLKELVNSQKITIFDVGAHTGGESFNFHNVFPKAIIHSFEPFPDSFLKLNYLANSISNIKAHNIAFSDSNSELDLFVTKENDSSSLLRPRVTNTFIDNHTMFEKIVKVKTITLDEFCRLNHIVNIDILKMDVQGAEKLILNGAQEMLSEKKIKFILTEVWFINAYENQALYHHIATYLDQFGYKPFALFNIHFKNNGHYLWGDAIFYLGN